MMSTSYEIRGPGYMWRVLENNIPDVKEEIEQMKMCSDRKVWILGVLVFLYYYMRNFCNLIALDQWYFSLIWNTYMWKLQNLCG